MIASGVSVRHSVSPGWPFCAGDVPGGDPCRSACWAPTTPSRNGRYRIKKIHGGENWNPELQAPLSGPGILVSEGDYLLEVNGRPLAPPTASCTALFKGTAGRQTLLRVNSSPSLRDRGSSPSCRSRATTGCAPAPGSRAIGGSGQALFSGGRLPGTCRLPNTGGPGYTAFNRYYYAQQDKAGAIIDERYNQGGMVADYIVTELTRPLMGYFARRDGTASPSPTVGIYGPKVMIVNESAGSGGDRACRITSSNRESGRWSDADVG